VFVKIFNALPHISISPERPQERMDEVKLYLSDRSRLLKRALVLTLHGFGCLDRM
jgi:hypothetical protein